MDYEELHFVLRVNTRKPESCYKGRTGKFVLWKPSHLRLRPHYPAHPT